MVKKNEVDFGMRVLLGSSPILDDELKQFCVVVNLML